MSERLEYLTDAGAVDSVGQGRPVRCAGATQESSAGRTARAGPEPLWIATERSGPRYDEFELTGQQHVVLGLIVTRRATTPQALAASLGVTKGAISQHLGALERDGYLSRRRSDRDGRRQVIELEDRGRAYRDVLHRFERSAQDRYLAALSAEVVAALTKLKAAFDD